MKDQPGHRRLVLQAGLALGASMFVPSARACEFFTAQLRIIHPWTRVSQGDTSAPICMVFDEVTEGDRLIGVETPIASGAELVDRSAAGRPVDFAIPAGRVSRFSEIGTHLRLTGLAMPLEMARTYPMALVFERGGRVEVDLTVDYDGIG